ncbi:hypothetical protein VP01_1015g6 [Puccinia sorghi]|uniref:HAP1 N-terminal domain-containing protein n=1 Tax=Puccinia sorghi TaxID=27349 RepID=A0A0L6VV19_9BASI|nr:hypothetical protein VP01_1015g6 [Puccinia sorghi]
MFDNSILLSRPRPPARKSSPAEHRQEDQPQEHRQQTLNDSPLSNLTKLLPPGTLQFEPSDSFIHAWSYEQQPQPHEQKSISHEWVEAKTREELENLLLAADRVIRERERDLGIAASIGKSLLENNIALRARQESLLAQVSASTPSQSHHPQLQNITNHSEHQQLSASPATLHRLAQQNEYLAQQLADLQAETAQSELEGRKRLRKLVKEIEALRADLHQTEERNALLEEERIAQLEQQNNNTVGNMVDEIVGDMKRVMMDDDHLKMCTPAKSTANFVTQSLLINSPLPAPPPLEHTTPLNVPSHLPANLTPSQSSSFISTSSRRTTISSHLSRSSLDFQQSPQERALVSQLLNKIAELKESQNEFEHEREEMKAKLRKAREEVEELQLMVEDAESELQQIRQLGWDDRRGLIEWDGQPSEPRQSGMTSRKASGNRKMINQSRKAKKRHWPAPEHQPGSIGSDITIPESIPSSLHGREPTSPSMRGHALSMARSNPDPADLSSGQPFSQVGSLRLSSAASCQSFGEGDKSDSPTPLRTLHSEIGGVYPEEEHSSDAKSPIVSVNRTHAHNEYSPIHHFGLPPARRIVQTTYNELQRAVADTPLTWADDNQSSPSSISKGNVSNERKRDSTGWLYNTCTSSSAAAPLQLDSWSGTSSATLGLMSASRPKADSLLRQRQLLIQGRRREELGAAYRIREDSQSSTLSSSTTIGRMSPSEQTSKSVASSQTMARRRTSRREEALRRLGIPSSTDTCSYNSDEESDDEQRGCRKLVAEEGSSSMGEESEEDGESGETSWNYIDATDHDHRVQGATGTDYFPISLRARHAPGMVVGRLQAKGVGWGTFVYQWMKLVSVVGLAVGWAVWQGPRSAMEDDYPFAQHQQQQQQLSDPEHLEHLHLPPTTKRRAIQNPDPLLSPGRAPSSSSQNVDHSPPDSAK